MALLMSGFLQVWFLIASFGTWYLIEHAGRRRSFIFSATGMAIVMFVLAAMLAVDTQKSGIVAAVMIFAYQAFYTWGFMGGVWVCFSFRISPQRKENVNVMILRRTDQKSCRLSIDQGEQALLLGPFGSFASWSLR